jgi:hypothetical protein
MAVAINKSITISNMGGLTFAYWKLDSARIKISPTSVAILMVPFVASVNDDGSTHPASQFSKQYTLTAAQAGLGSSNLGGANVGNFLRDTILAWLLANEADFSGGSLV